MKRIIVVIMMLTICSIGKAQTKVTLDTLESLYSLSSGDFEAKVLSKGYSLGNSKTETCYMSDKITYKESLCRSVLDKTLILTYSTINKQYYLGFLSSLKAKKYKFNREFTSPKGLIFREYTNGIYTVVTYSSAGDGETFYFIDIYIQDK